MLLLLSQSACGTATRRTAHVGASSGRLAGRAAPALPAGVVAQVAGRAITTQTLAHWTTVQALLVSPGQSRCIFNMQATSRGHAGHASARLTPQCKHEWEALQQQTLRLLIVRLWVLEETTRRGIRISAQEVSRRAPAARKALHLPAGSKLAEADLLALARSELLYDKLQGTLPIYGKLRRSHGPETAAMAGEVDNELQALTNQLTRTWMPQTVCRAGYIISECRNYPRA
jgi:hypothetical protein